LGKGVTSLERESPQEFADRWTRRWAGYYQGGLPSSLELNQLCSEVSNVNGQGPWTRVVLGWMYGQSQCVSDTDLLVWCSQLGNILLQPYFLKYRPDPNSREHPTENNYGNLGIQVWCSSKEDASLVHLAWPEFVVSERVFSGSQMQDSLRWMAGPSSRLYGAHK